MYILSNLKHFRFLGFSSCYEATQLFRRSGKAVLVILKGTYFNIVFTGPNKGNLGRIESNGIKAATTNRYSATSKMNLYLFSCFLCLYIVFFQLLVAKEQRLRFLKLQEAKGMEAAEEAERLRRLREKVDAQESKLKRLRALRGQGMRLIAWYLINKIFQLYFQWICKKRITLL